MSGSLTHRWGWNGTQSGKSLPTASKQISHPGTMRCHRVVWNMAESHHSSGGTGFTPSHSYAPKMDNQALAHEGTLTAPPGSSQTDRDGRSPLSTLVLRPPCFSKATKGPGNSPSSCTNALISGISPSSLSIPKSLSAT